MAEATAGLEKQRGKKIPPLPSQISECVSFNPSPSPPLVENQCFSLIKYILDICAADYSTIISKRGSISSVQRKSVIYIHVYVCMYICIVLSMVRSDHARIYE